MKRGWFLVLAISLGLNAGLLYTKLAADRRPEGPRARPFIWCPGGAGGGTPCAPAHPGDLARHRLGRLARWLGLSGETRARMEAIAEETMPKILAEREKVREARSALREEYRKPETDRERVHALIRDAIEAQARLDSIVAESMLREAELLTPEQRERYFRFVPWEREMGQGRDGRPEPIHDGREPDREPGPIPSR
jgi:Spy/CpxP family protein refolding chaperone